MTDDKTILDSTKDGALVLPNIADMKGQVADQVRAFLLNMLPKEVFERVVEQAWKQLTEPQVEVKTDHYGRTVSEETRPSYLAQLVIDELKQQIQQIVKKWGDDWRGSDAAQRQARRALDSSIERAAELHMKAVGADIVGRTLDAMHEAMRGRVCKVCSRFIVSTQSPCPGCGTYNS